MLGLARCCVSPLGEPALFGMNDSSRVVMRDIAHRGVILPVANPARGHFYPRGCPAFTQWFGRCMPSNRRSLTPELRFTSLGACGHRFSPPPIKCRNETGLTPPLVACVTTTSDACLLSTPKITPRYALHAGDRPALSPGMRDTHTRNRPFSRHRDFELLKRWRALVLALQCLTCSVGWPERLTPAHTDSRRSCR